MAQTNAWGFPGVSLWFGVVKFVSWFLFFCIKYLLIRKNVKITRPYFNFKGFWLSRLIFLPSVKAEPHSAFQYLKEPAGKPEGHSLSGIEVTRKGVMDTN